MASRPAAGGGIWVRVAPERIERWCAGFASRHEGIAAAGMYDASGAQARPEAAPTAPGAAQQAPELRLDGGDGASAACVVPFPPLVAGAGADPGAPAGADALIQALARHALAERRIGVLLVRRGGYAAGLFEGARLLEHKVGSRYVQGKTKAGGWSQQRYARRREGQARQAYAAAADAAQAVLLPWIGALDAVVAGGDAAAVASLRTEAALAPVWAKLAGPLIEVGDPRLSDLHRAPETFRAVRIRVVEAGA